MIPKRVVLAVCAGILAVMLLPAPAAAQHPPGPPPRTSVHVSVGYGYGYYRPYYPFYGYYPFYAGFGYGWGYPFYGYYGGPWGYPYPAYGYPNYSSARIEVKPRNAHVYLDGYLVGEVDQFDGVFQRLDLPTGDHEIAVYQQGYRTFRQRTLFRPGETYHFKAALEPLPEGSPQDQPPQPDPSRPDPYSDTHDHYPYGQPPPREPYYPPQNQNPGYPGDQNYPQDPGRTRPLPERRGPPPDDRQFGTLNVRVQPGDAVVVIDGERWDSPQGGSRLVVQLAAGEHRIEVRKDGFKPYASTIQLRPGETQTVNVSLPPGGSQ